MANIELDGVNKKIKVDSGDLTLDVPGDIVLDADGGDVVFADGGTNLLKVTNSSSDVVLQPQVDTKDIVFKQYDGTVVATVEDNATFNIPASKLAIGGTAVTSTAAELNILDGVTATTAELNLLDGGTSVGGSITLADGDGVVVNDGGTMKTIPASDVKTYAGGAITALNNATENELVSVGSTTTELDAEGGLTTDGSTLTIKPGSNVHQLKLEQNNATDYWSLHADSSGGPLSFQRYTGGAETEKFRIQSDGNVGIGETSPTLAKLQINQATSGTLNQICLRQDNNGGGDKQVIRFVRDTDESGSGAEVSAIIAEREGGNDTALVFKTDTAGGGSTTEHFRINAGGDLTATDTSIGSNSDQRLKENVADYSYDIDKFKTYKVKSFDWKNPARHRNKTGQIGFIAQDVESIDTRWLGNVILSDENDPDYSLISADGDGNRVAKTLKLGENDAMYISIIQQAITKIETLETDMTALKARVTTLEE